MPRLPFLQLFSLIILLGLLVVPIQYRRVAAASAAEANGLELVSILPKVTLRPKQFQLLKMADQPAAVMAPVASSAGEMPWVTAEAVYVMDVATAAPLASKAADAALYPASTTKLMTALVARNTYQLDQVITIDQEALSQGTTVKLVEGERVSVATLLTGLLIQSGNDTAFALANAHPFGYAGFVAAMNQTAQELGLQHTHFVNPSGLDQEGHVTTAKDLAIMAKNVVDDEVLRSFITTPKATLRNVEGTLSHTIYNTHELLGRNPAVLGGKTGTTPWAGEVLVTVAEIQGHRIIVTVMNSSDRYRDTEQILKWVNQHYEWLPALDLGTL